MRLLARNGPDQDLLDAAVGSVLDPELDQPLSQLGMIKAISVGGGGVVAVRILLTTEACPLRQRIADDVVTAVRGVASGATVEVAFDIMGEAQRQEMAGRFLTARTTAGVAPRTTVLAVASGKGGVGKSSVSANLAVALAQQGKSVGLLDADVWGYSVPQLFGVRRSPVALYETMLPVQAHGVRLMSLGFLVEEETPIVWRGPMLHKALTQFVQDVHWGDLDVLLLDLPPGTGDVTLSVLELLPEASLLVVTTPQQAARTVASRVGVMAREASVPVSGIIENMTGLVCGSCGAATALFGAGGGAELAEQLGAPLLGGVPLDLALREAGDNGEPVVVAAPQSPSARALSSIAAALKPARRSLVGRQLPLTPV